LYGESEAVSARKGPSLLFAFGVIGAVALATAGAVAVFFAQPSQGAPEEVPVIAAEQPIMTASLDPIFPPVRKVVTKSFPALKQDAVAPLLSPQPEKAPAARTEEVKVASAAEIDAAEVDALEQQDPRWASADDAPADDSFPALLPAGDEAADEPAEPLDDQPAQADDDSRDETRTAAIAPDEVKPSRESKQNSGDEAKAEVDPTPPGVSASTRSVKVSQGVNMRSRPKSGSGVLTTIPKAAVVQVVNCKAWCEVVYKGRRGFVYKDYLGGSKRTAAKGSSKKKKVAAAEPEPSTKTVYTVDTLEKPEQPTETPKVKSLSSRLQ
jgi:hypothetical protein